MLFKITLSRSGELVEVLPIFTYAISAGSGVIICSLLPAGR